MSAYPSSRSILDLCPEMQTLYYKFYTAMKQKGIDFIITATYRSNDDQEMLYRKGRSEPGNTVTNAHAGQSKHNCMDAMGKPASEAFDICIMENGKCQWDSSDPIWQKAGMIGKDVGLFWAGDWTSFKEYPHFQLTKES